MTINEVLKLLCYGVRWKIVGGKSGKVLLRSSNSDKRKEQWFAEHGEEYCCENCIYADFDVKTDGILSHNFDCAIPMIAICVAGK